MLRVPCVVGSSPALPSNGEIAQLVEQRNLTSLVYLRVMLAKYGGVAQLVQSARLIIARSVVRTHPPLPRSENRRSEWRIVHKVFIDSYKIVYRSDEAIYPDCLRCIVELNRGLCGFHPVVQKKFERKRSPISLYYGVIFGQSFSPTDPIAIIEDAQQHQPWKSRSGD